MRTRHVFLALTAVAVAGCGVSKDKHAALQKQLDETRTSLSRQLDERGETIAELEKDIADKDKRIIELEEEIAGKRGELAKLTESSTQEAARLQTEVTKLEGELANVLADRSQLKASAQEMKTALAEASKRRAEAERRVAEFRTLLARFKTLIDAGKLRVIIADGKMVLELPTDVLFPSGSAKLSDEGGLAIAEVTGVLIGLTDRRFQVEGHSDNVPIKTRRFPSNWELASARATVVVNTMMAAGMSGDRISAASFGEFHPVASNDTEEGRAANRRIQIVVVPDLSSLPGFDELKQATETN
jgi:chemotaxis protein MotB